MEKDILETLILSTIDTKTLWHKIFAGIMLVSSILIGLALIPFLNFLLIPFAAGFLILGLSSYTLSLLRGESPQIESIFSKWNRVIPAFCLLMTKIFYTILWGLLFIVPGIIACLNYSFAFFIMSENDKVDAFEALRESKRMVFGYRWKLFLLSLLYALLILALLCLGGGLCILFLRLTAIPFWAAVLIGTTVSSIAFFILILPFMQITYAEVYFEATERERAIKKSKPTRKRKKKTETA